MNNFDLSKETSAKASETDSDSPDVVEPKKKRFVAPEISVPVDVLEATTFFQAVDSGVTN
ncbi:MAG TPA: hypothetical protein VIF81_12160 [Pyrinomonadaceae bacterium]